MNVFEAGTLGRVHDSTGSIVESSIGQNTNFKGTSTIYQSKSKISLDCKITEKQD